jgi:hypothetical protein
MARYTSRSRNARTGHVAKSHRATMTGAPIRLTGLSTRARAHVRQSANSSAGMNRSSRCDDSQRHEDQVVDGSRASDEARGQVEFLVPSS